MLIEDTLPPNSFVPQVTDKIPSSQEAMDHSSHGTSRTADLAPFGSMTKDSPFVVQSQQILSLCGYLSARSPAIVHAWRAMIEDDLSLERYRSLSEPKFLGYIPQVLESLINSLRAQSRRGVAVRSGDNRHEYTRQGVRREDVGAARDHGRERAQSDFTVTEVTREFGYLHLCVADEIECYCQEHAECSVAMLHLAQRQLSMLINAGIEQSLAPLTNSTYALSSTRSAQLETQLTEFKVAEHMRGQALRGASHDLRGSLAVVESAASMIAQAADEVLRADLVELMQRSIAALKRMMSDMTQLAHLETGQETTRVELFDVSVLLRELCDASQPLARQHNLRLEASGPMPFFIEGDLVKTQRIAQNLLLNALKYTSQGGVSLSWKPRGDNEWALSIADTGQGIDHKVIESLSSSPTLSSTAVATPSAITPQAVTSLNEGPFRATAGGQPLLVLCGDGEDEDDTAREADFQDRLQPNEGIGLAVVQRLCALLGARLEVKSSICGSTFSGVFPLRYASQ